MRALQRINSQCTKHLSRSYSRGQSRHRSYSIQHLRTWTQTPISQPTKMLTHQQTDKLTYLPNPQHSQSPANSKHPNKCHPLTRPPRLSPPPPASDARTTASIRAALRVVPGCACASAAASASRSAVGGVGGGEGNIGCTASSPHLPPFLARDAVVAPLVPACLLPVSPPAVVPSPLSLLCPCERATFSGEGEGEM